MICVHFETLAHFLPSCLNLHYLRDFPNLLCFSILENVWYGKLNASKAYYLFRISLIWSFVVTNMWLYVIFYFPPISGKWDKTIVLVLFVVSFIKNWRIMLHNWWFHRALSSKASWLTYLLYYLLVFIYLYISCPYQSTIFWTNF